MKFEIDVYFDGTVEIRRVPEIEPMTNYEVVDTIKQLSEKLIDYGLEECHLDEVLKELENTEDYVWIQV